MKKFQFSLGRVLDYKDQVLDKEKNTLMQLRARRNQIEEEITSMEAEFENLNQKMQAESRKGITIPQLRLYEFQMENIRRMLEQLRRELKAAELEVEKQLKIVVAASQEVSGLDKLEQKQREEYRQMVAKADENFIAEFVTTKLALNREVSV